MILSHKIELIPTLANRLAFAKAAGCSRFAYNWGLHEWQRAYANQENPNWRAVKKSFNAIKKEQFPWIYESPKDANQQAFAQLGNAYSKFFKNTAGFPSFKKKGTKDSFYISNDKFKITDNIVKLPLIGDVKLREPLRFNGKITSATISRTAKKWFISVSVEIENYALPRTANNSIGLDFGVKTFAVDNNGTEYNSPKPLKNKLKYLKRVQRSVSRKKIGSKNREKSKHKVSDLHAQIANIRNDFAHKFTTQVCRENQTIAIETLSVKGWMKRMGRAASDVAIGETIRQLKYKSLIYNSNLVIVDRWFPSSKMCSSCGCYKTDLKLSDRIYSCDCGAVFDRDHNAAINIHNEGLRIGLA